MTTPPPRPKTLGDLDFAPFQPMVRWFTPSELVRSGMKAVLSSLFGAYADRRELQALQPLPEDAFYYDYADQDALWVDYVADLGDGWDATYGVASLMAAPRLDLPYAAGPEQDVARTQRGRVLVMGGDQVYPTATRAEYRNRLTGPYRAALPWVEDEAQAPHLFAVPGNHDWYDGLVSFTRLFCQQRWVGGWKTRQHRSYFALKLPHDWWLWGIDVQLASDIDLPQYRYFERLATDPAVMKPGSKVILCTAEPSWVYCGQHGPGAYQNLEHFETKLLRANGHEHVVGLAGDLHAYARYEGADGRRQRFVSGGGGAYLYPTHDLPERLTLPEADPGDPPGRPSRQEAYARRAEYPPEKTSRRLAVRALLFAWDNKAFALFLGAFYLFFAWIVQSVSQHPALTGEASLLQRMAEGGGTEVLGHLWVVLAHSPGVVFLLLLLFGGLVGFADAATTAGRVGLGLVHTLLHGLLMAGLTWAFAALNLGVLGLPVDSIGQTLLFAAEMLAVGSFLGGTVMGLYLLAANVLFGVHGNEVLLCQSLPTYKHFLRLRVDAEGVTIYPIGLAAPPRSWRLDPDAPPGAPWFVPERQPMQERAALVEPPVTVPRRTPAAPVDAGALVR